MVESSRRLFRYVAWLVIASLGTISELQSLIQGYGTPVRWLGPMLGATFGGACAGLYFAERFKERSVRFLPYACVATSAFVGSSGALAWVAFATPLASWVTLLAVAAVALSCAFTVRLAFPAVISPALRLGMAGYLTNPFRLVLLAAVLFVFALVAERVSIAQRGVLAGIGWALVAASYSGRVHFLYGPRAPMKWPWALGLTLTSLHTVLFGAFAYALPPGEQDAYPAPIVFASTGHRRYIVTRGLEGFDVYADQQLELSTLDEHRYFESLVHPAMLAAARHARVLVLEGGTGLAVREVFRYPKVEKVTIVATDRELVRLARHLPWLSERAAHSLDDPRVHVVFMEPAVWMRRNRTTFDVVIADFVLPLDYYGGKYYTEAAAKDLFDLVAQDGAVTVPGGSVLEAPRAFAGILATLRAAGFRVRPLHAPVPSLGVASFVLATRRAVGTLTRVPESAAFLNDETLRSLFDTPEDSQPRTAEPSTLYDQFVVHDLAEAAEQTR